MSLKACAGEGDPVSAAAKAAALAFAVALDAPAPPSEIFALWVFDMVIALRLRWPRPIPLIASKILDPTLRPPDASRRPRPGYPAWPKRRRRRDCSRRRRRPRPCSRSLPPFEHSDRRRAQTALETGPENRRPLARPRLRLARRSGPPRPDDRPRGPPAVRSARPAWRRA
jgi:Protein of unknown function (DUF1403)